MKLTVLGSGTSAPAANRSASGYFLETSGGNILLDCSPAAIQRMADECLNWAGLDAIWISHFHLDHMGGVMPFLQSVKHAPQTKGRNKPLTIYGPPGMRALLTALNAAGNFRLFEQRFPVDVIEIIALEPFAIVPCVETVAFKTHHTAESHGLHIRDGESTLVFTSDTTIDPGIASIANGVDLLLMECTFVRNKPIANHLELAEAMHIIRRAHPKRTLLTHLDPGWDSVNFADNVAVFDPPCEVIQAVDGLTVQFPE